MSNLLEITTLGGLVLRNNGQLVARFASRKAEALLVYLACSGRAQSREVLADLLWDERSQTQALTNLRTVLTSLRQQLAPYLFTDRQSIGLSPSNPYRLDVTEFESGIQRTIEPWKANARLSPTETAQLEQALTLYRGDFLEGFSIHNSQGFEDWMRLERERLRRLAVDALHRLVTSYLESENHTAGIAQVTRLLRLDPLREEAHRQLMYLLVQTGQRSAAIQQYENCRRLLDEELGIAPAEETTALYEAICTGTAALKSMPIAEPVPKNPYKGLRAFQEADAPDFFGREALTEILLQRLAEPDDMARFLAVIGPSGSGKSSVVRAGLIPALRRGALPDSAHWLVVDMYPGAYPLAELEAALLRVASNPPASLMSQLQEDDQGLLRAVKRILPTGERELVLVIDQFEEIFTLLDDESARKHFLDSLYLAVSAPHCNLRVIVTLRADFLDRPLSYANFGQLVRCRNELVLPLSPEELRQAIVKPAEQVGLTLEPDLVAVIVRDVDQQPGALPLLQHTLTELFARRDGHTLTLAAYRTSGGVMGALSRRAEELYAALDTAGKDAASQLFVRLVALGEGAEEIRRRVQYSELASLVPDSRVLDAVIETYSNYRLLTLDRDPLTSGQTIEIAHEALLNAWERLRGLLDDSRQDLRTQRRLMAAAAEWRTAGQDTSFLATGVRLAQFDALANEAKLALNREEREYLEASITQEARRKRHDAAIARRVQRFERATVLLAIVGMLSLIATGTAIWTANLVRQNVANATGLVESLRLSAAATTMLSEGHAETAALLSIRALQNHYSIQADTALAQAMDQLDPSEVVLLPNQTAGVNSLAFSSGGTQLVAGMEDGTVSVWDARTHEPVFQRKADTRVIGVAFSPDGARVLAGSTDGTVWQWDVHSGDVRVQTGILAAPAVRITFSPDGTLALIGGEDGIVRLWDIARDRLIHEIDAQFGTVTALAFSPDGTRLLAAGNSVARLWNTDTGKLLREFTGHSAAITSVAVSPDGKTILTASADKTARLWSIASAQEINAFTGNIGSVLSAAFSPDGKSVAVVGADRIVRVWDIATNLKSRQFPAHMEAVNVVVFSPDGRQMATGSADKTVRLWNTDIEAFIRAACRHLSRDFTDEERQQFVLTDKLPTCSTSSNRPEATP